MKRLGAAQARRCETGERPRCRCRCAGAFHGSARSQLPEYFEALPEDDPHQTRKRTKQLPLPPPVGRPA